MRLSRDGFAVETAKARKTKLPDWYLDEPVLDRGDEFYLEAFGRLSTCRQLGMSVGPIPWTTIREYGVTEGLDGDMLSVFIQIIMKMDDTFLDWTARELERKSKSKNNRPQPGDRK